MSKDSKSWTEYKKTELLKLPVRNWQSDRVYDFLLIVPSRFKHDSGFTCIAVIGCIADEPVEICAYPDDLIYPETPDNYSMRMDCSYPSGVLRLWSSRYKFRVPIAVSSTEIELVKQDSSSPKPQSKSNNKDT